MRLIDADKLIEDIEKLNLELFEEFKCADSGGMKITSNAQMYIICESVLPRIKEQPTAFDVDKVVKHIEECNRMIEKDMEKKIDRELRMYYEGQLFIANEIIKLIKLGRWNR